MASNRETIEKPTTIHRFYQDVTPIASKCLETISQLLEAGAFNSVNQSVVKFAEDCKHCFDEILAALKAENLAVKMPCGFRAECSDDLSSVMMIADLNLQLFSIYGNVCENFSILMSRIMLGFAFALQKQSRLDDACVVFQKCGDDPYAESMEVLGNKRFGMICLGEIEIRKCHFDSAVQYLQSALDLIHYKFKTGQLLNIPMPSRCAVYCKIGSAQKNDHKIGDALHSLRLAIAAAENDSGCDEATRQLITPIEDIAAAHINLGNLLHSMGDHTGAVPHYKKGIELSEECGDVVSYAWAHGNLGNTYLSLSQHREALHYLQQSLELTLIHEPVPTAIGRAHNNLGTYYQAVGDLDTAQYHYDTALAQAVYGQDIPGQACAYGNIGKMHLLRNDQERAITYCTEKLRLSHDGTTVTDAYHNRGCAYFELGEKLRLEQTRTRDSCQQIVVRQPVCMLESENQMVSVSCKVINIPSV